MTADVAEIDLPDAQSKSRLHKAPKQELLDDVATAGERIESFWKKHPDGSILTEVDSERAGEFATYTVRAFIRRNGDSERPDATAHATRSSADLDEITAAFPQETAETSAVSRALRNLGILAVPKKTRPPRKPAAGSVDATSRA